MVIGEMPSQPFLEFCYSDRFKSRKVIGNHGGKLVVPWFRE